MEDQKKPPQRIHESRIKESYTETIVQVFPNYVELKDSEESKINMEE